MMELLQKKEPGKVIICNLGNFYISIGKDATLLHNLLGLKVSCIKPEVCKVGFPICALEKYTELLAQKRYSFIIYNFDQKKEELKILESYEGKNKNKLTNRNINCYICSKSTKKYKKPDKYILALSKLYEKELEQGVKGYYSPKYKEISIEKRMSIDAKTAVLLHELTHGLYDDFDYKTDRNLSEVFVESVAYMVASYFRTRQFNVYF